MILDFHVESSLVVPHMFASMWGFPFMEHLWNVSYFWGGGEAYPHPFLFLETDMGRRLQWVSALEYQLGNIHMGNICW